MDIVTDNKHSGTTEQGVQAQDKAYGDSSRREFMLQASGIYIIKNGVELAIKPDRKGAT